MCECVWGGNGLPPRFATDVNALRTHTHTTHVKTNTMPPANWSYRFWLNESPPQSADEIVMCAVCMCVCVRTCVRMGVRCAVEALYDWLHTSNTHVATSLLNDIQNGSVSVKLVRWV